MARMEELSHCVALSERQALGLLRLLQAGDLIHARLTVPTDDGGIELLTVAEMQDLEARLELALREDER